MRFIHTADWHLGKLFHGKYLTNDQAYVLEQFCELVANSKAEAVIIAGDIYDRAVPPTEAVELLDDILAKLLLKCQVPVIVIAGNHDSPERIGFGGRLFEKQGLFIVGNLTTAITPISFADKYGLVEFLPLPYAEPALVRHVLGRDDIVDANQAMAACLAQGKLKVTKGSRKVAIAHAFLAGGRACESERILSVGGSSSVDSNLFKEFNYTALGHLHNAQTAGNARIRYSGSLLKYSFDEAKQTKGIHIVDIDAAGEVNVEIVPLTPKHDVSVMTGDFYTILRNRELYPVSNDYISVNLSNREPILDAFGQLREIYPNLLQIERPTFLLENTLEDKIIDHRKLSETDLFALFYREVTGEVLTDEENKAFADNLAEMMLAEREVKL